MILGGFGILIIDEDPNGQIVPEESSHSKLAWQYNKSQLWGYDEELEVWVKLPGDLSKYLNEDTLNIIK